MSGTGLFQLLALCVVLAATAIPLGHYMAAVYGARDDGSAPGDRFFAPIERRVYAMLRVDPDREQRWSIYAIALVGFSFISCLSIYLIVVLVRPEKF